MQSVGKVPGEQLSDKADPRDRMGPWSFIYVCDASIRCQSLGSQWEILLPLQARTNQHEWHLVCIAETFQATSLLASSVVEQREIGQEGLPFLP